MGKNNKQMVIDYSLAIAEEGWERRSTFYKRSMLSVSADKQNTSHYLLGYCKKKWHHVKKTNVKFEYLLVLVKSGKRTYSISWSFRI